MSCGASVLVAAAASTMPSSASRDAEAAAEATSCVAAGSSSAADAEGICRFCLDGATVGGDPLVAPCRCRGTARFVHESCLSRWRAVGRAERSFSVCLECRAPYKLRLRRASPSAAALGLWRARALDVLLRDFVPCFLLLQLCLVGIALALAAADPRRKAFRALGAYTCRATALMPPPRGLSPDDDDEDGGFDDRMRQAAIAGLRRACTREFYYIAAFIAVAATAAAVAAAAALARLWCSLLRDDDADSDPFEKHAAPPEPPAPRGCSLAPRDLFVSGMLTLTAFLLGGFPGAILALTAAALRAAQLRALARQRWRLVQAYAVVDGAYAPAGLGCERAHMLPDAHRQYLHALGFLPPPGSA